MAFPPGTVTARPPADRVLPLAFTIPGGSATLVRWLVTPSEEYGEDDVLARVRLPSGALWDLAARAPGCLDAILTPPGAVIRTGDWLALTRP
jgi:molecular chaperone DnaK